MKVNRWMVNVTAALAVCLGALSLPIPASAENHPLCSATKATYYYKLLVRPRGSSGSWMIEGYYETYADVGIAAREAQGRGYDTQICPLI